MTDPTIAAALRAARDTLMQGNCPSLCGPDEPCLCALDSAAAIAAFLRALPDGIRLPPVDGGLHWEWPRPIGIVLAAAIERAAREDEA